MKTPPATPEFAKFTSAMRDILKVSPNDMRTRIGAHKESGKRLSKGSSSLAPAVAAKLRSAVAKV
jgi:predicted Co/Zn/Cd cation transporter (cation efflux family)